MSEADTYVQELARLREMETVLRKELNQYHAEEAKALEEALRQVMLANRATSQDRRDDHAGAAQRARQNALEASRKAADVAQKIACNEKLQENTLSRLRSAERARQLAVNLEAARSRHEESQRTRQLERLASSANVRYEPLRSPTSEKLRVLYLTTNPYLDLMTELEVRQVQQALQGARYRERVELQLRPASTFPDLIVGLNAVRPHIVHFSGRAGEMLRLDDGELMPVGAGLDFTSLARALAATKQPPQLLVLNGCGPLQGATAVLPTVPVIIGLPESTMDTAAIVFAQHFYAAIARGEPVGAAFRLGEAKMAAALLDDASELPQVRAREDVHLDSLVLVHARCSSGA